jgi:hypothetical protein
VPIRADIRARLASATPVDALTQPTVDGFDSAFSLAERLHAELTEPNFVQAGEMQYEELSTPPVLAPVITELIALQPEATDVAVNVFPRTTTPELEDFQAAFLESVFLGTTMFAGENNVVAIFNLNPIEARARASYQQVRANASGIKLRLVSVSVETGESVMVDEAGAVLQRGSRPTRPTGVPPPPTTGVIDGAIASATMPGIFPARRLGDHMCVDGGVRDVVPVQAAVQEFGCNDVIAIRVSARPPEQQTDPLRTVGEVMARSVLELTFDEIADDDVEPFAGWGAGVKVTVIRPSFNLHDPMVVEPGLIRIAMDYGWMRAADILDAPEESRRYAIELSDRITRLRVQNWTLAHHANAADYLDPNRGFTEFFFAGMTPPAQREIVPVPSPEALDAVRSNCLAIRDALSQRLLVNAPTPSAP